MDKIDCITTFVSVVEQGNFSKAARHLNLSRDIVAKRIAYLENHFRTSLFHRTTREMHVTDSGDSLYKHCKVILGELEWAEYEISHYQANPKGELRISAPLSYSNVFLKQVIDEFTEQYPEVTVNLILSDSFQNVIGDGFDITLRISEKIDCSHKSRTFLTINRHLYATPAYFKTHGMPKTIEDLRRHKILHLNATQGSSKLRFYKENKEYLIDYSPILSCNNGDFLMEMCLADKGIVFLPDLILEKYIQNKQLVQCLPDYHSEPIHFHALWPAQYMLPKKVRFFIDMLAEHFKNEQLTSFLKYVHPTYDSELYTNNAVIAEI